MAGLACRRAAARGKKRLIAFLAEVGYPLRARPEPVDRQDSGPGAQRSVRRPQLDASCLLDSRELRG